MLQVILPEFLSILSMRFIRGILRELESAVTALNSLYEIQAEGEAEYK